MLLAAFICICIGKTTTKSKLDTQRECSFFKKKKICPPFRKQSVCADCELSSPASQHRDLPLLFWECVDCMTHTLMYLSVSVPASGQQPKKRKGEKHVADHRTRWRTAAWDGRADMFQIL